MTKLEDIAIIVSGSGFPLKYQGKRTGKYPFFKVGDMNSPGNEIYMTTAAHYISEDVRKQLNAKVILPNSVIFPKVGGAILTNKKRITSCECCIDNNVMSIWVDPDKCLTKYFLYFFNTIDLFELSNKAALPSINQSTLIQLEIPVPSLKEQKKIINHLDNLLAATEKLRMIYQKKMNALNELNKTILHHSFTGQPIDKLLPELI